MHFSMRSAAGLMGGAQSLVWRMKNSFLSARRIWSAAWQSSPVEGGRTTSWMKARATWGLGDERTLSFMLWHLLEADASVKINGCFSSACPLLSEGQEYLSNRDGPAVLAVFFYRFERQLSQSYMIFISPKTRVLGKLSLGQLASTKGRKKGIC